MSTQLGKLCSLLLLEYFGDSVEKVGLDLFRGGQKKLRLICITTGLSINEVRQSLYILIKYGLANFQASKGSSAAEYSLCPERIVYLLRYPRYLMLMKKLYGNEAEIIVEEILRNGRDVAFCILLRSFKRISNESTQNDSVFKLQRLKDIFEMLVNKQYIIKCSTLSQNGAVFADSLNESERHKPPKIDIQKLFKVLTEPLLYDSFDQDQDQDQEFWEINFDRFHQDLRDELLIYSTARRTNQTASDIMQLVLQQMQLNSQPWSSISNPISISEIKESCKKSKIKLSNLKDLEDYLTIMTEEFGGFLRKSQMISAAYEVNLKQAIINLTWCILANGVEAKFGSNAARIFRLIKEQEFIEQDEIQKRAMLHDKEAKFLTYSLLQSGWIQQHELKKGLQKAGPTKTFYLFCIEFRQVVRMYIEACYKGLYNAITLREQEKAENKCLLEKKQRIDAIILHMKKEGATDEQVSEIEEMVTPPEHVLIEKIHVNVNKVSQAELQMDETLFILQLCLNLEDN